jgi:hypothetical protein
MPAKRLSFHLRPSRLVFLTLVCVCFGCGGSASPPASSVTPPPTPGARDPLTWPFSQTSIWNHPIGSAAVYVDAGFTPAANVTVDEDWWVITTATDPSISVYDPFSWGKRCGDSTQRNSSTHFPAALLIPDAQPPDTPNNASGILEPDGRTIQQYEPTTRCVAGGPLFGYQAASVDIYGEGIPGGHFGSGLSSIGGTIRVGELRPAAGAIRHALKIEAWAQTYYYYSSERPGFRWPADRADDYAARTYHGANPALTEGSLLAIPPAVSVASLNLTTDASRKIAQALQDYGGYIVDDTAWDDFAVAAEINSTTSVRAQFYADYGYYPDAGAGTPFFDDMNKVFSVLKVVDNNSASAIGGGGAPLVPLAPPLTQ